jgi:RHS repeat-associated protein
VSLSITASIGSVSRGQWFQAESGLDQNWMRDYDPTTGRYLQADPLGLVDGASVYGYARQNPGRWVDPRGEDPIPSPPPSLPGGPYEPTGLGQRTGAFYGPKQPSGPRTMCQYVPKGAVSNNPEPYWKVKFPGQRSWQWYDTHGNPTTPQQAHPGDPQAGDDSCWCELPLKFGARVGLTMSLILWATPAE